MNGNGMLLVFADLSDEQVAPACDIAGIRQSFQRYRTRRITGVGALCVCLLAALSAAALRLPNVFPKTPATLPPTSTLSQPVPTTEPGTTRSDQHNETTSGDAAAATTGRGTVQEETARPQAGEPTRGAAAEAGTEPAAPVPETTDGSEAEPAPTTNPATVPEHEAAFYCLYTYSIVGSAFSSYLPGKVVDEAMVGDRLEDAAATTRYVYADGRIQEDETLRCEIFALTDVDPEVAVCVRFIDKGKGLTTDHYYLLYDPGTDTSASEADRAAIEAYLIPEPVFSGEE